MSATIKEMTIVNATMARELIEKFGVISAEIAGEPCDVTTTDVEEGDTFKLVAGYEHAQLVWDNSDDDRGIISIGARMTCNGTEWELAL